MHMTGGKISNRSQVYDKLVSFTVTAGFIWPRQERRRQAGSSLIPFSIISTAISQSCREQRLNASERSINGLLMLPSYISSLCYFKPGLRFTFFDFQRSYFSLYFPLHKITCWGIVPEVKTAMQYNWNYGKQKPHYSIYDSLSCAGSRVCFRVQSGTVVFKTYEEEKQHCSF